MQNKANFLDALMNVKSIHTVVYENKSNWKLGKNKANTKPIKANLLDAQMNVTSILTKDYENQGRFQTPGKQTQSNPISKGAPMLLCGSFRICQRKI